METIVAMMATLLGMTIMACIYNVLELKKLEKEDNERQARINALFSLSRDFDTHALYFGEE